MTLRTKLTYSLFASLTSLFVQLACAGQSEIPAAPVPLLATGRAVDWWFVYKFNTAFPGCGANAKRTCPFGGKVQPYKAFSQQFVYASSANTELERGSGCAGATTTDPVGATFDQLYNGPFYYVFWNDQFYGDPKIAYSKCSAQQCGAPWGHSKGVLAWNDAGEGLILQVTTPSWPAAASQDFTRKAGNTLGCIVKPNNVVNAQHFFAVKLTKDDLLVVLKALQNASVVTKQTEEKIFKNGGPEEVRALVDTLGSGKKSDSRSYLRDALSTGVEVISKPSDLHVPPWQMVSAALGGVSLRTATWWAAPRIYTTTRSKKIGCWDDSLKRPGRVEVALTGEWQATTISLIGGANHAKIGVSISGGEHYAIFGDLNQQGATSGTVQNCARSQNGRGGLFFVVNDKRLHEDIAALVDGDTAPTRAPARKAKR